MHQRLLLVDDQPAGLTRLEQLLAPLNHELILASSRAAALGRFQECRPDVVLLDLTVPGMDGVDVLTAMRQRSASDPVGILALVAPSETGLRALAFDAGADDCLEKPVDGPALRGRVGALLRWRERVDGLRAYGKELACRNDALERIQHMQRELSAFVVHDLKTPLATLCSSIEFARQHLGAAPLEAEALDEAGGACVRLQAMIEDLLTLSRLEESKLSVNPEPIRVGELVGEVLREYARRAEAKQVKLLGHEEARGTIHADRTLLRRIIENILDNSLRHTPANGRVCVSSRVDHAVEIAVSNTGPAIPAPLRSGIFDKFARLDEKGPARANVGLGLYFCKRAIEALGGDIEVTETPEWPTSFVVRLPASAALLDVAAGPPERGPIGLFSVHG